MARLRFPTTSSPPVQTFSFGIDKSKLQKSGPQKSRKSVTDPCQILLPVDPDACSTARQIMANGDKPMVSVAACVSQDPIMVLEFLKIVNRVDYAAREGHVTTLLPALVRLGSEEVVQILYSLRSRPAIKDPTVAKWVEFYRNKGRRLAIVARILAEKVVRTLREDCLAAGALMSLGDMLAAAFLEEKYVALAEQLPRAKLNYQLAQNHNFDVEKMTLRFLNRQGIPESLVDALNLSAKIECPQRARSRTVCYAAAEMVESFDADRWDRLEPGRPLPPKSFVRSLWLSQKDYTAAYERTARYLFESRLAARQESEREGGNNSDDQAQSTGNGASGNQLALGCAVLREGEDEAGGSTS